MQYRVNFIRKCLFLLVTLLIIYVLVFLTPEKITKFVNEKKYYFKSSWNVFPNISLFQDNDSITFNPMKETLESEDVISSIILSTDSAVISSVVEDEDETILSQSTLEKLKSLLNCKPRYFDRSIYQRSDYWVLKNFIKAGHGELECHSNVTFVTHGDFTYLDKLEILVEKWIGPISLSLYAPGKDFEPTLDSLRYVRDCGKRKDLIRKMVSFHIYFHKDYMPEEIPNEDKINEPFNCSLPIPYRVNTQDLFMKKTNLLYPVNVGRNIARDAALTHYFLSLDIELYPIPKLGTRFLNMLVRNESLLDDKPKVFVMKPFEVASNEYVPENKTKLIEMLRNKTAIPFHQKMCPACHNSPHSDKWMAQGETKYMEITGVGKRTGAFKSWEPLFISTHSIPYLEERLSWDGKRDKMTQTYVLCVLDYDFLIMSNAFVTHHPGIKTYVPDKKRDTIVWRQNNFIDRVLKKELLILYGSRNGCIL